MNSFSFFMLEVFMWGKTKNDITHLPHLLSKLYHFSLIEI